MSFQLVISYPKQINTYTLHRYRLHNTHIMLWHYLDVAEFIAKFDIERFTNKFERI